MASRNHPYHESSLPVIHAGDKDGEATTNEDITTTGLGETSSDGALVYSAAAKGKGRIVQDPDHLEPLGTSDEGSQAAFTSKEQSSAGDTTVDASHQKALDIANSLQGLSLLPTPGNISREPTTSSDGTSQGGGYPEAPSSAAAVLPKEGTESGQTEVPSKEIIPKEDEWGLKIIEWPPLPPPPSSTHGSIETGPTIKIICQNANGPCSLIALCNILILRSDIVISPPNRASVTYTYLSSIVADYLLKVNGLVDQVKSSPTRTNLSLSSALSILPSTRFGLNLNLCFGSIEGFKTEKDDANSTAHQKEHGELALFEWSQVPLVHGWVVDPQDQETWHVVVEECGDYDRATEKLIEGKEIAGELGDEGALDGLSEEEVMVLVQKRSRWTREQEKKVFESGVIQKFLNTTSTQLTYHGLYLLSTKLLPSSLSALFHNSHLSVLYRRPRTPLNETENNDNRGWVNSGPTLFTLVTDSSFANEPEIVWESLEDVDGSASEFYNGALRKSSTIGGDWVSRSGRQRRPDSNPERNKNQHKEHPQNHHLREGHQSRLSTPTGTTRMSDHFINEPLINQSSLAHPSQSSDHDFALAQQLQQQEEDEYNDHLHRTRRQQREQDYHDRGRADSHHRREGNQSTLEYSGQSSDPSSQVVSGNNERSSSSNRVDVKPLKGSKDKKDCVVM